METATIVMDVTAEALIERIETNYAEIIRIYRSVPVTKIIDPSLPNGWSAKDVMAHIGAWEWRCASLLDASHTSNRPLLATPDVDALNQEILQERASWSWEEVEYDARAAHHSLLEAIRQLPPHRLANEVVLHTIASETWEHYYEHLKDLKPWRDRVARSFHKSF